METFEVKREALLKRLTLQQRQALESACNDAILKHREQTPRSLKHKYIKSHADALWTGVGLFLLVGSAIFTAPAMALGLSIVVLVYSALDIFKEAWGHYKAHRRAKKAGAASKEQKNLSVSQKFKRVLRRGMPPLLSALGLASAIAILVNPMTLVPMLALAFCAVGLLGGLALYRMRRLGKQLAEQTALHEAALSRHANTHTEGTPSSELSIALLLHKHALSDHLSAAEHQHLSQSIASTLNWDSDLSEQAEAPAPTPSPAKKTTHDQAETDSDTDEDSDGEVVSDSGSMAQDQGPKGLHL